MSNTFFEQLKALYSKADIEYDANTCNPWMLLNFVSHDTECFNYVETINRYLFTINPKYIWKYLRYKLPVHRNKFLKYTKRDRIDDSALDELCTQYGISKNEAKIYVQW